MAADLVFAGAPIMDALGVGALGAMLWSGPGLAVVFGAAAHKLNALLGQR